MKYFKYVSLTICFFAILLLNDYNSVNAEKPEDTVENFYKSQDEDEKDKEDSSAKPNEDNANDETNKGIETNGTPSAASFGFSDFFRMIAATAFVIVLLYVMLRFVNKKNKLQSKGNLITNLGGLSVGGNKSVQLIKIGNAVYLVGVGEEVRLIKEITDESEVKQLLEQYNENLDLALNPTDLLSKFNKKYAVRKEKKESSFVEQFKLQLEKMTDERKKLQKELREKVKTDNE